MYGVGHRSLSQNLEMLGYQRRGASRSALNQGGSRTDPTRRVPSIEESSNLGTVSACLPRSEPGNIDEIHSFKVTLFPKSNIRLPPIR